MRVFAPVAPAYVSNSHLPAGGWSLCWCWITVAVLFLRNQIRPILRRTAKLRQRAEADSGRAARARCAARRWAFIEMKRRIERSWAAHRRAGGRHDHAPFSPLQARTRLDRRQS
jgi:hypothetical protein